MGAVVLYFYCSYCKHFMVNHQHIYNNFCRLSGSSCHSSAKLYWLVQHKINAKAFKFSQRYVKLGLNSCLRWLVPEEFYSAAYFAICFHV